MKCSRPFHAFVDQIKRTIEKHHAIVVVLLKQIVPVTLLQGGTTNEDGLVFRELDSRQPR